MFSTLPVLAYDFHPKAYYTPQVSSPLSSSPLQQSPPSPRHGNDSQQPRLPMPSPTPNKARKENPYSKRVVFSNPLVHDRNDGREARRKLFLKKVRQKSQDTRWDARGGDDEVMRTIWVAEQRRQAQHNAREATTYVLASHEEEPERDIGIQNSFDPSQTPEDEAMVDEVAQFEHVEIEAALSSALGEGNSRPYQPRENLETPYCSDDEEYDSIFLEVIEEVERSAGVEEYNHVFQDYLEEASKDRKHVLVDANKPDHDMMDIT